MEICKVAGIKHVIVHHFGMFAYNTGSEKELKELERKNSDQLKIIIPKMNVLYIEFTFN
ncbi:MAG: hypothetical protein ACTSYC_10850 [Promethearchaeota archaeon]